MYLILLIKISIYHAEIHSILMNLVPVRYIVFH